MELTAFLGFIPLLIYLGFFIFVIFSIITILNLMKERNDYLKEIRDELKKNNGRQGPTG